MLFRSWDANVQTREWSRRYFEKERKMPNHIQAGVYGAVMHYLKAVKAAGTDDGQTVVAKMRELPINDFFTSNGTIREDGRVMREFHLMEVKTPEESQAPWDYFKLVRTLSPAETAIPLADSQCPTVKR